MNLSKLWEIVEDRGAWCTTLHGVTKSRTQLSNWQQQQLHFNGFSSVQSLSRVSLRPHELQHARLPCLSLSHRVCSNSCPLSRWCHPTIILCLFLLLLSSIFLSIRVFSSESALYIRWPKYWSFSFNISPSNEHSGSSSPLGWTRLISLQSKGLSRVFSRTTIQKHQFFSV